MTRLIILGAGTLAVDVFEAATLAGDAEILGFVVSEASLRTEDAKCGLPVADLTNLSWRPADAVCVTGIVSPARANLIDAMAARGFAFATIRHPTAIVSPSAVVGAGCFIGAGAIIGAHSRIADHVIVNRGANVGHDLNVDSFATIGPGATIAGAVTIGRSTTIGAGAVVRDHISIGSGVTVAAGAVVLKDVPDNVVVLGNPARIVKS